MRERITIWAFILFVMASLYFLLASEATMSIETPQMPLESTQTPLLGNNGWIPDSHIKVERLANAIYKADGGSKTNFPYGIKSIKCEGHDECRRICKNTIRNNIERFKRQSRVEYTTYLLFLQNRYSPTAGNLTRSEKELNHHWISNVTYFLKQQGEVL